MGLKLLQRILTVRGTLSEGDGIVDKQRQQSMMEEFCTGCKWAR